MRNIQKSGEDFAIEVTLMMEENDLRNVPIEMPNKGNGLVLLN